LCFFDLFNYGVDKLLISCNILMYQAQYYDCIKLLETFSRFRTRVDVSHLRPVVPVKEDCRAWWRYAMLAGLRQKKLWYISYPVLLFLVASPLFPTLQVCD
jgi:hypothetical protein